MPWQKDALERAVQLSVNCQRASGQDWGWQVPPSACVSCHARLRSTSRHHRGAAAAISGLGPQRESGLHRAAGSSAAPHSPPQPHTAAQAAAPNRQQNAGMENSIQTVVAKNSPISRLEPIPIHLPTPPAHSGGTVTAGVENCEQTSRLPLFHLVPAGTAAAAD